MKPGVKTTEFYLTIIVALWGAVSPTLPPHISAAVVTVSTGLYAIGRGLAKGGIIRGRLGEMLTGEGGK